MRIRFICTSFGATELGIELGSARWINEALGWAKLLLRDGRLNDMSLRLIVREPVAVVIEKSALRVKCTELLAGYQLSCEYLTLI